MLDRIEDRPRPAADDETAADETAADETATGETGGNATGGGAAGGCVTGGHRFGGPGGWRACACERSMAAHHHTPPDPAGGPGCGMVWRVCTDCAHVDEHHITDHHVTDHDQHTGHERAAGRGAAAAAALDGPGWPVVVTLCGSMRFAEQMSQVAGEETACGAIVLTPFVAVAAREQDGEFKAMLDELHRRKIDLSDRVVVVSDATGYIGESTRAEIIYASRQGVPVTYRHVTLPPVEPDDAPDDDDGDGLDLLVDVAEVLDGAYAERMRTPDVLGRLIAADRDRYGRWRVTDLVCALAEHGVRLRKFGGASGVALSDVREALAAHGSTVARSA